jgi:hypothetical protein
MKTPLARRLTLAVASALATATLTSLSSAVPAVAQTAGSPTVVAQGLDNPRGLTFGPRGLHVAEAGVGGPDSTVGQCPQAPPPIGPFSGGPTGRVSRIDRRAVRHTVSEGLASARTAPESGGEVLGPEEVVFLGAQAYVLVQGGGCAKANPSQPNGIYRIMPDGGRNLVADLSAWFAANPTAGPQDDDRDPEGVPTSMVVVDGRFYVLEGNHAQLVEVTLDGQVRRVVDLSAALGQRTFTALEHGPDGNFYVANFGEVPYPDGSSRLWRVTPEGQVTLVRTGLTTVIDIRFDRHGRLFLLESSTGNTPAPPFLVPGSGRVRALVDGRLQTVADGLTFPTAMTFGDGGDLFVSNRGYGAGPTPGLGEILRVPVRLGDVPTRVPSEGCNAVNNPELDSRYVAAFVATRRFLAGETLTMTAAQSEGDPTVVRLRLNGAEVDSTPFPGTVTHTFATDTEVSVEWRVDGFVSALWTVSCDPPPVPGLA